MNKNILILIFFSFLISNSYAFEIIGKSKVKNVEKCINNSSKLLDKDINKQRCVIKFQKKVDKKILQESTGSHKQYDGEIYYTLNIKNNSPNIVVTGFKALYKFSGLIDGEFGTLEMPMIINGDPKHDPYERPEYLSNIWLQPSQSDTFYFPIQNYKSCPKKDNCTTSEMIDDIQFFSEVKVSFKNKNLKYEIKKLEKDKWTVHMIDVYGVYIK